MIYSIGHDMMYEMIYNIIRYMIASRLVQSAAVDTASAFRVAVETFLTQRFAACLYVSVSEGRKSNHMHI